MKRGGEFLWGEGEKKKGKKKNKVRDEKRKDINRAKKNCTTKKNHSYHLFTFLCVPARV